MCCSKKCPDSVPGMATSTSRRATTVSGQQTETAAPEPSRVAPVEHRPSGEREAAVRMTCWVRGEVQGVGFRWFTRANALRIGALEGFAVNLGDGRVQVVAEGARQACEELLSWLCEGDTPGRVDGVTEIWSAPRGGYDGFAIR